MYHVKSSKLFILFYVLSRESICKIIRYPENNQSTEKCLVIIRKDCQSAEIAVTEQTDVCIKCVSSH